MPTPASIGHWNWKTKALCSACIAILLGTALISAPRSALGVPEPYLRGLLHLQLQDNKRQWS
jgi:hypothetical protein